MIKISKNLKDVPESLDHTSGIIGSNTHKKRQELIDSISYIDTAPYNNRYKYSDTKEKLKMIYNGKCAFCENKVEQLHVEHYRPKAIYYWLAFSWDNLLLACPTCNQFKGNNFQTLGPIVTYANVFLNSYNNYSSHYDVIEQPLLINPEVIDPSVIFTFSKNGEVSSDSPRGAYTIETCKLDRDYLNDGRKKILDDFRNKVVTALNSSGVANQKCILKYILDDFKEKANDKTEPFISFRKKSIKQNYLKEIIKESLR